MAVYRIGKQTHLDVGEYIGASTDTKPTGVAPGSEFYEYNTGNTYVCYDGTNWSIVS